MAPSDEFATDLNGIVTPLSVNYSLGHYEDKYVYPLYLVLVNGE